MYTRQVDGRSFPPPSPTVTLLTPIPGEREDCDREDRDREDCDREDAGRRTQSDSPRPSPASPDPESNGRRVQGASGSAHPTDANVSIVFAFVGLALVLGSSVAFLGERGVQQEPLQLEGLLSTLILSPILLALAALFARRPPVGTAQQRTLGLLAVALLGRSLFVVLSNPGSIAEFSALIPILFGAGFYLRSPTWLSVVLATASTIAATIIWEQPAIAKPLLAIWLTCLVAAVALHFARRSLVAALRDRTTNERVARAEAEAAQSLLQRTIDAFPAMVNVKDSAGQVILMNRAQQDFLDESSDSGSFFPVGEMDPVGAQIESGRIDRLVLSTGQPMPMSRRRIELGGGREATYLQTKIPMTHGEEPTEVLSVALDITELEETREALAKTQARWQSLLEGTQGWIFTVDEDGVITMASHSVAQRSADDLTGRPLKDLMVRSFHEKAEQVLRQAIALGRPVTFEAQMTGLDERWFSWTVSPVKRSHEISEIVIIVSDITDLRREEDERRQLERRMSRARKMESLGILAGGIAHDFNNLLVGVLGNANLLRKLEHDPEGQHDLLKEIESAALRATELCDQMLAYAGLAKIKKAELNLTRLVEGLLPELRSRLGKDAEVLLDLDEGVPPFLGDRGQIDRVILNLVTNAHDAGSPGPIRRIVLRTKLRHLETRALKLARIDRYLPAGDYICLEVQDFGKGMGEGTLSRIFDPFFSTKFAGRGLGLAAVQGIVKSHSGGIYVESVPGHGTCVSVFFPVAEAPTLEAANPRQLRLDETPRALVREPGAVTLVVDDEDLVRRLALRTLKRAGFDVVEANRGNDALVTHDEMRERIECVVLDLTMPEMSGEEVFSELRRRDPNLPVIITSGFSQDQLDDQFRDHATRCLGKPYAAADLVETVIAMVGPPKEQPSKQMEA